MYVFPFDNLNASVPYHIATATNTWLFYCARLCTDGLPVPYSALHFYYKVDTLLHMLSFKWTGHRLSSGLLISEEEEKARSALRACAGTGNLISQIAMAKLGSLLSAAFAHPISYRYFSE